MKIWRKNKAEEYASKLDEKHLTSYSQEAPVYDKKRYMGASGEFLFRILNNQLEQLLDLGVVLDVATGTGRVAIPLSGKCSRVIGLDLTSEMIQQAKAKADRESLKNVSFVIGNGRILPFKDNTFSTVTCVRFFHLISPKIQSMFLDEFYRCVKPGGKIIVEYNNPFCNFGLELLRNKRWRKYFYRVLWPWQLLSLKRKFEIKN